MFSDDVKFLQKAIVFHPTEEKFLILKRAPDSFSRPNDWDFPGGNVLFGENHEESLRKEIKEETGLIVGTLNPIEVKTKFEKSIYYLFLTFSCTATSDQISLSHEHTQFQWITKTDFLTLDTAEFLKESVNCI
jgi:8-oxo-dGTP diphosphatase